MKIKIGIYIGFLSIGIALISNYAASAALSISKVYDGDTITLSTGERVRLLQIDTPEISPRECYGDQARAALVRLLKIPGELSLKTDAKLDTKDRYGRLLRYVFIGQTNINLRLVEIGAAVPYFYKGAKGHYSSQLLEAAHAAKSKSLGLWKSCPSIKMASRSDVYKPNSDNHRLGYDS